MLHMLGRQLMCFSMVLDPVPQPIWAYLGFKFANKTQKITSDQVEGKGRVDSRYDQGELGAYTLGK